MPSWSIRHIPHNSTVIPESVRDQFLLADEDLAAEIRVMTDHRTAELFGAEPGDIIAPVSRLVVDVERFADDQHEPMGKRGMGAVYSHRHDGRPLRREITDDERQTLLRTYYEPHHAALTEAVDQALQAHGGALIIDCHSYPTQALPYERNPFGRRPEICIGTDPHHTPAWLIDAFTTAFRDFDVEVNTPFSGALVPKKYYRQDLRVFSIMIEVRRDVYLDDGLELRADVMQRFQRAMAPGRTAAYWSFRVATAKTRRKLPRCSVAEFAAEEMRQIDRARAKHLRACQVADKAGRPRPDLKDFVPELFWYALGDDAQD